MVRNSNTMEWANSTRTITKSVFLISLVCTNLVGTIAHQNYTCWGGLSNTNCTTQYQIAATSSKFLFQHSQCPNWLRSTSFITIAEQVTERRTTARSSVHLSRRSILYNYNLQMINNSKMFLVWSTVMRIDNIRCGKCRDFVGFSL